MSALQATIDRLIEKHGADFSAVHLDLLTWFDAKWPDPRKAPEVLRVPGETFMAVMQGLQPIYRFCDPRLVEAGLSTVRLRPFGCVTSLVLDEAAKEPTPDTIEAAIARAA